MIDLEKLFGSKETVDIEAKVACNSVPESIWET